jgi:hypothetical protein
VELVKEDQKLKMKFKANFGYFTVLSQHSDPRDGPISMLANVKIKLSLAVSACVYLSQLFHPPPPPHGYDSHASYMVVGLGGGGVLAQYTALIAGVAAHIL